MHRHHHFLPPCCSLRRPPVGRPLRLTEKLRAVGGRAGQELAPQEKA